VRRIRNDRLRASRLSGIKGYSKEATECVLSADNTIGIFVILTAEKTYIARNHVWARKRYGRYILEPISIIQL
jgi:hypothetical protein